MKNMIVVFNRTGKRIGTIEFGAKMPDEKEIILSLKDSFPQAGSYSLESKIKGISPGDPALGDFALFGAGVNANKNDSR